MRKLEFESYDGRAVVTVHFRPHPHASEIDYLVLGLAEGTELSLYEVQTIAMIKRVQEEERQAMGAPPMG